MISCCTWRSKLQAVLRIHDILGWIRIRIRGSMPLTNGSGFGSGSWIRILLFSSLTFKMPAKNKFFNTIFSACDFLKLDFHHFSKIKIQKDSQNSRNQGFSYYFCMVIEGSGSGFIPLTSGSGSGSWRPKNTWIRWIRIRIRIRIRNTGFKSLICGYVLVLGVSYYLAQMFFTKNVPVFFINLCRCTWRVISWFLWREKAGGGDLLSVEKTLKKQARLGKFSSVCFVISSL